MKKHISLLLTIALLCTLYGCKAKSEIIGSYTVTVDVYDTAVSAFDQGLNLTDPAYSIGNDLSDFSLTFVYAFHQDGTYKVSLDEDALNASLDTLKAAIHPTLDRQFTAAFQKTFAPYGIALESVEDIEALIGKSADEYFTDTMGQSKDAYIHKLIHDSFLPALSESLIAEGRFIAEDGMLYLSDSLDAAPSEDRYETYIVGEDGTIVITGCVNVEQVFSYPYLLTPMHK